jgi:hypothetical protein
MNLLTTTHPSLLAPLHENPVHPQCWMGLKKHFDPSKPPAPSNLSLTNGHHS